MPFMHFSRVVPGFSMAFPRIPAWLRPGPCQCPWFFLDFVMLSARFLGFSTVFVRFTHAFHAFSEGFPGFSLVFLGNSVVV